MPQPGGPLVSDDAVARGLSRAGKGLDAGHVVLQRLGALVRLGGRGMGRQVLERLSDGG